MYIIYIIHSIGKHKDRDRKEKGSLYWLHRQTLRMYTPFPLKLLPKITTGPTYVYTSLTSEYWTYDSLACSSTGTSAGAEPSTVSSAGGLGSIIACSSATGSDTAG